MLYYVRIINFLIIIIIMLVLYQAIHSMITVTQSSYKQFHTVYRDISHIFDGSFQGLSKSLATSFQEFSRNTHSSQV